MKRIADPKALQLLMEGTEALAVIEGNGIRVDVEYLDRAITETDHRIVEITETLKKEDIYRTWEKRFKHKANLDSRPQLAEILFDVMKLPYPVSDRTETGRYRTDGAVLQKVKIPFVQEYLKLTHLKKDRETYLGGIRREVVDGLFHPSYNLHLASTFRSSSGADREDSRTERDLNFQNLPVRDPARAEMIRQAFIPREGCHLVEVDFSGIEVRIACAYNKDPNLKRYIEDPTTDMHRDTAMELFSLGVDQVEKRTTRDWTKNRFVFPEFYGSVYFQCAPHIWEAVVASEGKIPGADTTIRGWLEKQGIKELGDCNPRGRPRPGTFEFRVKEVEELFWKKRFTVYDQWKKDWFAAYQKNGGFKTLTGFWIGAIGGKQGLLKRNDVSNWPIQGAAFHCLLWTLIQLTKEIRKRKMKTKVVGQIHDSVIADVPEKEIQDYLEMAKRIMTVDLPKAWTWINVPLDTEAEVCPLGGSWHTKEVWEKVGGIWCPKKKK